MSLGGGMDREWCEPLDSAGNRSMEDQGIADNMVGCHTGVFAGLNIHPKPGFEYKWLVDPESMGINAMSGHIAIQQQEGEIVQATDDEYAAFNKVPSLKKASDLDTVVRFNELVLVRIPIESARRIAEENAAENLRRLHADPAHGYANSASAEEQLGYASRGPTRFRGTNHQTTFRHGDRDVEVSTPDSGIVRTETLE